MNSGICESKFSLDFQLFKEKQIAAAASENQTNEILDNQEEKAKEKKREERVRNAQDANDKEKDAGDDLEETIRKAIQKVRPVEAQGPIHSNWRLAAILSLFWSFFHEQGEYLEQQ